MTIWPRYSKGFYGVLLISLVVVAGFFFWPVLPVGGPFGSWEARRDVERGRLALMVPMHQRLGMDLPYFRWEREWESAVRELYGVELIAVPPGSFGGGFPGTYREAYNAVQRQEMVRRFGRDVVEDARRKCFMAARETQG